MTLRSGLYDLHGCGRLLTWSAVSGRNCAHPPGTLNSSPWDSQLLYHGHCERWRQSSDGPLTSGSLLSRFLNPWRVMKLFPLISAIISAGGLHAWGTCQRPSPTWQKFSYEFNKQNTGAQSRPYWYFTIMCSPDCHWFFFFLRIVKIIFPSWMSWRIDMKNQ